MMYPTARALWPQERGFGLPMIRKFCILEMINLHFPYTYSPIQSCNASFQICLFVRMGWKLMKLKLAKGPLQAGETCKNVLQDFASHA